MQADLINMGVDPDDEDGRNPAPYVDPFEQLYTMRPSQLYKIIEDQHYKINDLEATAAALDEQRGVALQERDTAYKSAGSKAAKAIARQRQQAAYLRGQLDERNDEIADFRSRIAALEHVSAKAATLSADAEFWKRSAAGWRSRALFNAQQAGAIGRQLEQMSAKIEELLSRPDAEIEKHKRAADNYQQAASAYAAALTKTENELEQTRADLAKAQKAAGQWEQTARTKIATAISLRQMLDQAQAQAQPAAPPMPAGLEQMKRRARILAIMDSVDLCNPAPGAIEAMSAALAAALDDEPGQAGTDGPGEAAEAQATGCTAGPACPACGAPMRQMQAPAGPVYVCPRAEAERTPAGRTMQEWPPHEEAYTYTPEEAAALTWITP